MKRILSVCLIAVLLLNVFPPHVSHAAENEIPEGYVQISTPEDLWNVRYNMDKNYILMNDLDLTESMSEGGLFYQVWTALGVQSSTSTTPFEGVFDGNGHSISGWSGGCFIAINNGTIKNLTINGSNGGYGMCGTNNGTIANCHKFGYIDLRSANSINVGGICSYNCGTIESCSVHGSVKGVGGHYSESSHYSVIVGGIVGINQGTIRCSYNAASVSGYSNSASPGSIVGGICGQNSGGGIEDCYNCGDVLSCNSWSTTSDITEKTRYAYAAGLAAKHSGNSAYITRCYNVGAIEAKCTFTKPYFYKYVGALTAEDSLYHISDCYYINNMNPCSDEHASNPGNNTHLTSGLMQMSTSFPSFDFTWVWDMGTGDYLYPVLRIPQPTLIHVPEDSPTCLAGGRAEYWYNKEGTIFADEAGTEATTLEALELPPLGHDYQVVVTPPTCTEPGFTTHTCTRCENTYSDSTTNALGHMWSDWHTTVNASCGESGEEERTCSRCELNERRSIPALGHNYSYSLIDEPTLDSSGSLLGSCSRCVSQTTISIPQLNNNDYDILHIIWPTCTGIGRIRYTWKNTDYGVYWFEAAEQPYGHTYTTSVIDPTCTEEGYVQHVCSICGDEYKDAYSDPLGHDLIHHNSQAPSCTEIGWSAYDTCSRCNYSTYIEEAAVGHNYQVIIVAPSCTERGYSVHKCVSCGDNYVDSYVDALGHNFGAWTQTVAPTCTTKGSESRTCPRCSTTETREVNALGHDLINHAAQAPTCTTIGWDAYDTCSRCDYTTYVEKAALGHNYQATVTKPTCTEQGYTTHTCSRCGDSYVDSYIEASGHKPGAAVEENRVNPTCTNNGGFDTVTYCSVCGSELSRIHTNLAALGHVWDNGVVTPATCTADGVKTFTCQRCGETKAEVIAATGHTQGEAVKENEVAATCTTAGGYDMVIRCTICNAILYTEHFEIAALGHDYQAVVTAPTCTEKGFTTYTCSRCSDSYVADDTEPTGHSPTEPVKENVTAATCIEPGGYDMVVYCSLCGAELSREHFDIPATGHDWNEPTYVWADDCSEITATRVCKNDASHTETEKGTITSEVTLEATVDAEGEITYTATFTNPAFATQTKKVATPKLDDPGDGLPCDGGNSCPGNKFTDMPAKGNWAHDAIDWAIVNTITSGTSATTFSPNAGCTRAQVVTFLWRAAGSPEPTSTNNPFTDVTGGYYYKAVLWAVENNITSGTSATTFSPNSTCTRAQIITFLWRFEGSPAPKATNNPFTDVKPGSYYEKAVLWASETGVTAGTSATTFSPDTTCTRAQVVTFLYRNMLK